MRLALSQIRWRCKDIVFVSYAILAFVFVQVASPHSHVNYDHTDGQAVADGPAHAHSGQTHTTISQPSDEHRGAGLEIDSVGPMVLKNFKVVGDLPVVLVFLVLLLLSLQLYMPRWALWTNIPPIPLRDRAIRPPLRAPPR